MSIINEKMYHKCFITQAMFSIQFVFEMFKLQIVPTFATFSTELHNAVIQQYKQHKSQMARGSNFKIERATESS